MGVQDKAARQMDKEPWVAIVLLEPFLTLQGTLEADCLTEDKMGFS